MKRIVIEWPQIPPPEVRGNNRRYHWRAIYKKGLAVKNSICFHTRDLDVSFTQAKITFHFYNSRKVDLDNLAIGMKPVIDQLNAQGFFDDDDPTHVIYGNHTFSKCKRGEEKTVIEIEEVME